MQSKMLVARRPEEADEQGRRAIRRPKVLFPGDEAGKVAAPLKRRIHHDAEAGHGPPGDGVEPGERLASRGEALAGREKRDPGDQHAGRPAQLGRARQGHPAGNGGEEEHGKDVADPDVERREQGDDRVGKRPGDER